MNHNIFVEKGDDCWGSFSPMWEGALVVYLVGDGDVIVLNKEGKLGQFLHDVGWETGRNSIEEIPETSFVEFVESQVAHIKGDPAF